MLPSRRVLTDLRARIEAGEWEAGDHMPSARELAVHYGVSTRTVAKAYAALAAEGLVVVTPSWGTHRA
jgi:DNA-binding GntR family transcriptional regulator